MTTLTTDQLGTRVTTGLRVCVLLIAVVAAISAVDLFAGGAPGAAVGMLAGGAVVGLLFYALIVVIETLLDIAASVSPEE